MEHTQTKKKNDGIAEEQRVQKKSHLSFLCVLCKSAVRFYFARQCSYTIVIPSDFRILEAVAISWVVASGISSKVYFIFSVFHLCRPKE